MILNGVVSMARQAETLPSITAQPASRRIALGQTAALSVGATGTAPLAYEWFVGNAGTTIDPIAGATSSSYTPPALTTATSYWVRVANAYGSLADSLTATMSLYQPFTDDTLTAESSVVRAVHLNELRTRIDALRVRFGLVPYAWTDATITAGSSVIKVVHITDLRAALAQACIAAGQAAPTYTNPALGAGTPVKAAHIAEIRTAIVAIE